MRYWLAKTEPETFSIDDLQRMGTSMWEGVRSYQARNTMRDVMKRGDPVIIYHSNAKPPGVAGLGKVVREAYPDFTAWDPTSKYFDPGSTPENPRWVMVDVGYVETFPRFVPLDELRTHAAGALEGMVLLAKGSRLSVQPVTRSQYQFVLRLARGGPIKPRRRRPASGPVAATTD
jgi:predicted RNA-binding protein with PUA-like domain